MLVPTGNKYQGLVTTDLKFAKEISSQMLQKAQQNREDLKSSVLDYHNQTTMKNELTMTVEATSLKLLVSKLCFHVKQSILYLMIIIS